MGKQTVQYITVAFLFLIAVPNKVWAQRTQQQGDSLVQFSGLVVSSDSLKGLEAVNIRLKGRFFGTVSNYMGIFSLVTRKGDTVVFSSIGYKKKEYVVPHNLNNSRYSMIISLSSDTFTLDTVFIKPFISRALLPYYFENLDVPEAEEEIIARKNLEAELLRQQSQTLPADGRENQNYYLRQESAKYYYSGQMPPISILNPFAWAQFFKAWERGDFKSKKKVK